MTRRLLLMFVPIFLVAAGPEDTVKAADSAWATAVVKKDYAALERVLSDDLAYTHSNGKLDSKKDYIESLRSGKQAYTAAEHQSIDVRLINKDIALVRATLRMTATSTGTPAPPANFSVLRVYQLKGGHWQMVAHQSARLAQ
jgi:ketosteroid isomerase-like protein